MAFPRASAGLLRGRIPPSTQSPSATPDLLRTYSTAEIRLKIRKDEFTGSFQSSTSSTKSADAQTAPTRK